MKWIAAALIIASVGLMGWSLSMGTVQAAGQDEAAKPDFYTNKVQPIFKSNCYRCHGGINHRGGLNIQTQAGMTKGGHDGPVLVPGDPAKSLLVRLIRHEGPADGPRPMPPKSPKISDEDIATVERWVKAGAIMPEDTPKP
jgi:mono/diheme cytochrome c family protein